jgi:hypothetical protein
MLNVWKTEPALVLEAVKVGLVMFVTFGFIDFSNDQQTWVVAAVAALIGLAKAFSTHPFPVTAVTDAVQAVGIAVIGFHSALTQAQLATLVTFVGVVVVLIQRAQISPKAPVEPTPVSR